MARAVVLGAAGGIGRVAARALTCGDWFDDVVLADLAASQAAALADSLAAETGHPGITSTGVDAVDPADLARVLAGADVAVSCIGPFYRFGAPVLAACIRAGVHLVDVCDDLDATIAQLELDGAARAAGVVGLIGMGNSPGLANVLVRYAADELLDTCDSVDIMHIHGGEPDEGSAVVKHRIHAMVNDVPLFVDGEMIEVRLLEESAARFVEETDFRDVGRYPVFPYPHPETITLPRHIPGLRRATNRGVVYPMAYFEHTMDTVRRGLALHRDTPIAELPVDDWVAEILAERPRFLAESGLTQPGGCLKIVVGGTTAGERHTYVFSLSSAGGAGAGEGTGIPAALGAILIGRGAIADPGVHPPEAAVDPMEILALAAEVVAHFDFGPRPSGDDDPDDTGVTTVPIHIEHHRPDGTTEELSLGL
jgi:saccharopine dehydrogenase (NAD+, L-lysine-forming)